MKRSKRFEMQNAFTTFASSRFVDREAVVATLRERAEWLKRCQAEVVAVYLFGFFATGSATPGISIGGVVRVSGAEKALRWEVWQAALAVFRTLLCLWMYLSSHPHNWRTGCTAVDGRPAAERCRRRVQQDERTGSRQGIHWEAAQGSALLKRRVFEELLLESVGWLSGPLRQAEG